jgi:endonuclease/exonuclease/phosphatase family metal-dependent hydrolase
MTAPRPKTFVRALVGLLALGVLATPTLVSVSAGARVQGPQFRKVSAPNVFYPVTGTKAVKDLKTSSKRHPGTDIKAACKTVVYATHPGTARVLPSAKFPGKTSVRVSSNTRGLLTGYSYLDKALVDNGQILQSGQPIGYLGRHPKSKACALYFTVSRDGVRANPTAWLDHFVGTTPPVSNLFNTRGFNLASFNLLGASHTPRGSRYATYPSRLNRAVTLMNTRKLDVIGTQEFQEVQYDYFVNKGYSSTFGAWYWNPAGKRRDTENAVIWRKSTMQFVSGTTFDIPYFGGNIRHVPAVLLREKSSGRTAYFLNVHNPANVRGDAAKYRARAIAIEKQKIIDLRATGRPVFITGDFNDRAAAFCPLTANKLSISPNSIPSMVCRYPRQTSIDWIFAAGQARFSSYSRDTYPQTAKISDHPVVIARTHLQN